MAYYYSFNTETGALTGSQQTKPEGYEGWLTTDAALTGSLSDYLVSGSTLYRLSQITTEGIYVPVNYIVCGDFLFGIQYDADTEKVTSVVPAGGQISEFPYIMTTEDPGDVTDAYVHLDSSSLNRQISGEINGVTYTIVGTVTRLSDIPDEGSEGDVYVLTREDDEDYREYFVWNGAAFSVAQYDRYVYTLRKAVEGARVLTNVDTDDEDTGDEVDTTETGRDEALDNATEADAGTDMIVRLTLSAGNWAVRTGSTVIDPEDEGTITIDDDEKSMVYVIGNDFIRQNTIFQVLGVTRGMLRGDISWTTEEGYITFETAYGLEPYGDVVIDGVFHSTSDTYNAQGKIEAWPQGEWRFAQYSQQLQEPGWQLTIPAGESRLIETSLDFTLAHLLQLSCEWGGNTHAVLTQYYVNSSNKLLYFRLTNIGSQHIQVSDILLDICYHGTLTNLVTSDTEATAEDATDTYITDEDIDEIT